MDMVESSSGARMSVARWAIICIPLILLSGYASGLSAQAGASNGWYVALDKPWLTPPDWVFPIAWTTLYILMGWALALVLGAGGTRGKGLAAGVFGVAFIFNLAWTPIFFGAHRIGLALAVNAAMLLATIAATILFGRIRTLAAWLMLPYLVWISFAGVLTWRIGVMNPGSRGLASTAAATQITVASD